MTNPAEVQEGRWVSVLRLVGFKLMAIAALTAAATGVVCLTFGAIGLAAWFAFGSDCPPFPWFLLRFFLAFGWMAGIGGGLLTPAALRSRATPPQESGK